MKQLTFWGFDDEFRPTTNGWRIVYFIESRARGIKIGFTARDAETRRDELQTGSFDELIVIGTLLVRSMADEGRIQDEFAPFHVHDEWFVKTPELMAAIARLLAPLVNFTFGPIPTGKTYALMFACPHCRERSVGAGPIRDAMECTLPCPYCSRPIHVRVAIDSTIDAGCWRPDDLFAN